MVLPCILLILILLILAISYYCYRVAFYSPKKGRDTIPQVKGDQYEPYRPLMRRVFSQLTAREYEDVTITSHDGLKLAAKYYHMRDGAPLAIAFHGYRSSCFIDFAGGSELCFDMGQNLLLVDQRAHGKSQGNTISFGILERLDCLSWVNYAAERFGPDTPMILYGVSMGATTVVMASGLPLPDCVKGIVADCPYSSPSDIILSVCKQRHYPPRLAYPFICLGARIFGHFNLRAETAENAVKLATVPILLIHGEADGFVPQEMSAVIARSAPDLVKRVTFPGADHAISYLVDEPRYRQIVTDFVNSVLNF